MTADQIEKLEHIQEDNEIGADNLEHVEMNADKESLEDLDTGEKAMKRQKHNSGNRKNNTPDKILDLFHKNSTSRQEIFGTVLEKRQEDHPLDLFFNSIAASVKQLAMERQIRAKMQILQIVGQLELEEYASRPSSAVSTHSYSQ